MIRLSGRNERALSLDAIPADTTVAAVFDERKLVSYRPGLAALFVALVASSIAVSASATPVVGVACNLRGSWVASTAEANRYLRAANPTASSVTVTSGALSATFSRGLLTFGSLGLKLKVVTPGARLKQELTIESIAPYTASSRRLSFGRGTYKLRYISAVVTTSSGITVPLRLPGASANVPASSTAYTCTPSVLHLRVPLAGGRGVTPALRRDRG